MRPVLLVSRKYDRKPEPLTSYPRAGMIVGSREARELVSVAPGDPEPVAHRRSVTDNRPDFLRDWPHWGPKQP